LQSDRTSKNIVCFIFELKLSWPLKQVFSIVLQQIISRNTSQRIQLKSINFLTLLSVIRKPGSMSELLGAHSPVIILTTITQT
jgi:hypothetical protein